MPQTQSINDVMNLIHKKLEQTAKKTFVQAEGPLAFWLHNGTVMKNLKDLQNSLSSMAHDIFTFHVHDGNNDFANWVEHVMQEPDLAKKLRRFKTQKTMSKAVAAYIKKFYAV